MAKAILFSFFIAFSFFSLCQLNYRNYSNETDPVIKADIGSRLIDFYRNNSFDSVKIISLDLLLNGIKNEDRYTKSVGEVGIGCYFIYNGSAIEGVVYLKNALRFFEENEDWARVSEIYNEIGNGYFLIGEYMNAIHTFIASQDYGELSNDVTDSFNGGIGLAKSYFALGDTIKGLMAINKYKELALGNRMFEAAANATAYIGMIEQDRGNYDASLSYFEKSIEYGCYSNSDVQLSNTYTNKAIVLFNLGDLDSSLILFEKALELRQSINRPRQIVESYFNLASYYIQVENYKQAITELEHSIYLSKNSNLSVDEYDAVELLAYVYNELDDSKKVEFLNKKLDSLKLVLSYKEKASNVFIEYVKEVQKDIVAAELETEQPYNWAWIVVFGILLVIIIAVYFRIKISSRLS